MSIENAKKFCEEHRDEIAEKSDAMTLDQLEELIAEQGYDFTARELQEAVLNMGMIELDDAQLSNVSGGGADGPGNCTHEYYEGPCKATVEKGSWCGSNDFCVQYEVQYKYLPQCMRGLAE